MAAPLHNFAEEQMAEMACLIVHPEWQGSGEGEILLRHMVARPRGWRQRLFVLTTRTSHWFIKRGFVQGGIADLPRKSNTTTTARATAWSSSEVVIPGKRHALSPPGNAAADRQSRIRAAYHDNLAMRRASRMTVAGMN